MKRALVISGGGSKGAFAIGVLKRLQQEYANLDFDCYVGTSTGSLIIPLMAVGELNLLETIYTTQTEGSIVKKMRIGDRIDKDGIFDANPLWNLINVHFTDAKYNTIQTSGKKFYINTVCLQTEELVVFTNDVDFKTNDNYRVTQIENANHFRRAVMASACQPVFMPTIQVNKDIPNHPQKNLQFVDGGVRQYAGIEMAIDAGAKEIFTILLSSSDASAPENKQYTTLFDLLQKTISIFTTDVGKNDLVIPKQFNEALQYIEAVKNKMVREGISRDDVNRYFFIRGRENPYEDKVPLKLFTIRPNAPLGGGPGGLSFDPAEMKAMITKGKNSGSNFIASLNNSDITWA
jgi:NTE family protein